MMDKRMQVGAIKETDGRRLRRESSRRQVIAAMLDLVREGTIQPRAEDVALRSGVGLRTVFRLFNDMESLYREMMIALRGQIETPRTAPLTETDPQRRLEELVRRRAEIFQIIEPFQRSALALRHGSIFLKEDHARLFGMLRKSLVLNIAGPDTLAPPLFESLDAIMGIEFWLRLRDDQGLSPEQTTTAILAAARAILAAGGWPRGQDDR